MTPLLTMSNTLWVLAFFLIALVVGIADLQTGKLRDQVSGTLLVLGGLVGIGWCFWHLLGFAL